MSEKEHPEFTPPVEIDLAEILGRLQKNPAIQYIELKETSKLPRPDVWFGLNLQPIESVVSDRARLLQELLAVIGLGDRVALGVIKGQNTDGGGGSIYYLSLMENERVDRKDRARIMAVLVEGAPITITRTDIERLLGRNDVAPGVSGIHCTIVMQNGVLLITDEGSTNGTSVMANRSTSNAGFTTDFETWAPPSTEVKKFIPTKV